MEQETVITIGIVLLVIIGYGIWALFSLIKEEKATKERFEELLSKEASSRRSLADQRLETSRVRDMLRQERTQRRMAFKVGDRVVIKDCEILGGNDYNGESLLIVNRKEMARECEYTREYGVVFKDELFIFDEDELEAYRETRIVEKLVIREPKVLEFEATYSETNSYHTQACLDKQSISLAKKMQEAGVIKHEVISQAWENSKGHTIYKSSCRILIDG